MTTRILLASTLYGAATLAAAVASLAESLQI